MLAMNLHCQSKCALCSFFLVLHSRYSHLLSDQNDPFNRSPLTMDQVLPNEELRHKIEAWIAERRAASKADS